MPDYIITSDGELMHYGVKGMKWGVRRKRSPGVVGRATVKGVAKLHQGIANMQRKSAQSIKKDADSIRSNRTAMLSAKSRNGKSLFTEKDIDDMLLGLDKQYKTVEKKARSHERFAKQLINELGTLKLRELKSN